MATIPSQHTWAVGETVTAANMNSNVRDALNFSLGGAASRKPSFRANFSAVQSIPNAAATNLVPNVSLFDSDSGYTVANGIYTVKTAGLWMFSLRSAWAGNATGVRGIYIGVNGNSAGESWMAASNDVASAGRANVTTIVYCNANDTVNGVGYQNSGAALNFATINSNVSLFAGCWLAVA